MSEDRFFPTRCEHCGWAGSSGFCELTTDYGLGDGDVLCPKCGLTIMCDDMSEPPERWMGKHPRSAQVRA